MHEHSTQLERFLSGLDQVVVAFSGGVDSSVVAAAAYRACSDRAVAVTAQSPSVARWQLQLAETVANEIGITHQIVQTHEVKRNDYRANNSQRCFYCKETLYQSLQLIADQHAGSTIVSGTNADDLGDHRPGINAGERFGVVTPLAELGIGKTDVRRLARHYGLSNHSQPASPCLASRIAYGTEVTAERLARVERAEDYLRGLGFEQFRVRLHGNGGQASDLARIEVPQEQIERLIKAEQNSELTTCFRRLGFAFVSLDLAGFQSGSMNRVLVNLETPQAAGETLNRNQEVSG